jgi:uncharacterized repeat protein (TIGR01451 family)
LLTVLLAGLLPATALAQRPPAEPAPLLITSSLERLVATAPGSATTMLEPVGGAASHADQLIYTARFTNQGRQVLDAVRITSPIPADLRYLQQSATGPASAVVFSIDHARTFGPPAELTVVQPDGSRRVADPADYTHVRWVLEGPLDPGATGVVRFGAVPR